MKLNLGSGHDYRPGFVNIDAGPFKKDRDWDVFARLPLADGAVEEIVAIDVLEHAPWPRTEAILREWVRVLRPGGKITLQVPNLPYLCQEYLDGRLSAFEASRWIYGGQGDGGHGLGPAHAHLNAHGAGFDPQRLVDLCETVGLLVAGGGVQNCGSNLVLEATKR